MRSLFIHLIFTLYIQGIAMPIPENYTKLRLRLGRFLSKDKIEAESPTAPQVESNIQVIGNYLVTPVTFYIKPPKEYIYELNQIFIRITDNNPINPENYVSGGPLANGINYEVITSVGSAVVNTIPIKRISDYISYVGNKVSPIDYVANPNSYAIEWPLVENGKPLFLNGANGEGLCVIGSDNFTSLTSHTARVKGMIHYTDINKP